MTDTVISIEIYLVFSFSFFLFEIFEYSDPRSGICLLYLQRIDITLVSEVYRSGNPIFKYYKKFLLISSTSGDSLNFRVTHQPLIQQQKNTLLRLNVDFLMSVEVEMGPFLVYPPPPPPFERRDFMKFLDLRFTFSCCIQDLYPL